MSNAMRNGAVERARTPAVVASLTAREPAPGARMVDVSDPAKIFTAFHAFLAITLEARRR